MARIVHAGAVKHLAGLMDPAAGIIDKAVAVLSNLAMVQEGRNGIAQAGGIPVLVEVVELGSARSKENAVAALLQSQVLQPSASRRRSATFGSFATIRHSPCKREGAGS